MCSIIFFFNDTATTEIYTLSLHDALPISRLPARRLVRLLRPLHLRDVRRTVEAEAGTGAADLRAVGARRRDDGAVLVRRRRLRPGRAPGRLQRFPPALVRPMAPGAGQRRGRRSEERRVGKECRSRWATYR